MTNRRCLVAACLIAIFFSLTLSASGRNFAVLCQPLLSASTSDLDQVFLDTYRSVLLGAGSELLTPSDLERMLETKDYFQIDEAGPSTRDHIRTALRQIRLFLDSKIEDKKALLDQVDRFLRTELSRIRDQKNKNDRQRDARRIYPTFIPSTDWARKIGENTTWAEFEYAGVSADQSILFEFHNLGERLFGDRRVTHLRIWKLDSGQEIKLDDLWRSKILRFAVSKNHRYLAIYSHPDGVRVIDLNGLSLGLPLRAYDHASKYGQLWFSENADRLFQFVDTSHLMEFNLKTRRTVKHSKLPSALSKALIPFSFAPQGGAIAVGKYHDSISHEDGDGTRPLSLHIVDPLKGEISEAEIGNANGDIQSQQVRFSADGRTFIQHAKDRGDVAVWNSYPTTLRGYLTLSDGKTRAVNFNPKVSPNGETIIMLLSAYSGIDGRWLFDLEKYGEIAAFSSDGRWVAVGQLHGTEIQIYDLRNKVLKARYPTEGGAYISAMLFAPDGLSLAYHVRQTWHVLDLGGGE